ncbi:MAG: ABC transporter ATP-binding protein/permease [Candidatus Obscuribacterales bacterium]|nr:ABC transporter ATP-binding protein/permease [Candidatus Obscuribacterales bacterium]
MSKNAFETLVLLVRGFFLVFRSSPLMTIVVIMAGFLCALEPVAHLWIMKLLIDRLTKVATTGSIFELLFKASEFVSIGILMGAQFGLWIGSRLLNAIENYCSTKARYNFELHVQTEIMRKCSDLDLAFFENSANLDSLDKALRGSMMSAWNLVYILFSMINSAFTMVGYLAVLFMLHWLAPIIVIITSAPQMVSSAHFSRKHWKVFNDNSAESRLRGYLAWIMGDKNYAKEIKLFNLSDYIIERYRHFSKKIVEQELKTERLSHVVNFFLGGISSVGMIGIWTYVVAKTCLRLISVGDAYLYLGAAESSRSYLLNFFWTGGRLYEQILFLSDLFLLLDRKPDTVEGALAGMAGPGSPRSGSLLAPIKLQRGIELRNVSFRYPGSESNVLSDLSVVIPVGSTIAIVGKNGAGKSTLVKLLVRLYDAVEGEILIDGRNIKEYDLTSLRKMYSVVFQDFVTYYLTLRENIGFGDIEKVHDSAQVMWAAEKAGAAHIVDKLPLGYETYLARQYGVNEAADLSGGEWQKVALARSFMREALVVILDEPTASLDAFAESELFESLEELTRDKLSVIISHRFSTVKVAKLIIVLDEGKIVESGSHQELVEKGGLYAEMYAQQADRYK